MNKFEKLGLSEELLKSINELGFEKPTPIQENIIPVILEGYDVIGQAQTGTGKTAAFGLPTLNKIDVTNNVVQALVIAPTRELAVQSQEELFRFGREKKVKVRSMVVQALKNKLRLLNQEPILLLGHRDVCLI